MSNRGVFSKADKVLRSANRRISITLVGASGFGVNHLRKIELMEMEGGARLLNVVEPFLDRIPELSEMLREKKVSVYQSWEDLMVKSDVADCIILAVPIPLHLEYAIKAYECGAYVYLEKPPVPLWSQMERLVEMERLNPLNIGNLLMTFTGFTIWKPTATLPLTAA